MQEVTDNPYLNMFDSLGYTLITRAVFKNIATFAEEGDQSEASRFSIDRLYFAAGTRQPFRETYFAANGLFMQGTMTGLFWSVVTLIRLPFSYSVQKTWSLAKEGYIVAISNLACQFIAFVGMCRPKWGVTLWFYATRELFSCAGDEIVTALSKGIICGYRSLYPALEYNLGKDNVIGLDVACASLDEKVARVATALKEHTFWSSVKDAHPIEDRLVEVVTQMLDYKGKPK